MRTPLVSGDAWAAKRTPGNRYRIRSALLTLVLLLEACHNSWVGQSRGIAQNPSLRDVSQQPPHDLAGACFRQVGREKDVVRPCKCAYFLRHELAKLIRQLGALRMAVPQRHE